MHFYLNRCIKLLHRYALGDKPIQVEFLSDQSANFSDTLHHCVNYQDPNLNIAYPIYSIHGNHDDPSGFGRLSSLDLLSSTGLINYFGKWTDLENISIKPLLMRKGQTKLAIYGLSHIHDNRLCRLFLNSKVIFERPSEDTDSWFNVLVLHQNRANRGEKNYLPDNVIPSFINLVIWGHEHDCRIRPEENANGVFISQPGSSVATSLSYGESIDKHIATLAIEQQRFQMHEIKLETVRPFVFETIDLTVEIARGSIQSVCAGSDLSKDIQKFASDKIEEMIKEAEKKLNVDNKLQPKEPLLRLRLDYSDEDCMFNAIRFGQQYNKRVANPTDIILFKKHIQRKKIDMKQYNDQAMKSVFDQDIEEDSFNVEKMVEKYFNSLDDDAQLDVLFTKSMSELCCRLVQCDDDDAAENIIKFHKEKICQYLNEEMPSEDNVLDELKNFRLNHSGQVYSDMLKMLDNRGSRVTRPAIEEISSDDNDDDDGVNGGNKSKASSKAAPVIRGGASTRPARGRGSRGGRTTTAAATSNRKQPTLKQLVVAKSKNDTASTSRPTRTSPRKPRRFAQYDPDSD